MIFPICRLGTARSPGEQSCELAPWPLPRGWFKQLNARSHRYILLPRPFVAKNLDGDRYTSDSLKGNVVLIEFWATWCKYCKSDERAIESVNKDFAPKGLVVLAVDMGEPKRTVKRYLDENPRSPKIVLAEDTTLAAICEAKSYPLYVLLDREGNVAGRQHGAAGEGALRRLLGKAGLEGE